MLHPHACCVVCSGQLFVIACGVVVVELLLAVFPISWKVRRLPASSAVGSDGCGLPAGNDWITSAFLSARRQIDKEKKQIFNIFIRVPVLITQFLASRAQSRFLAVKMNQEEMGEDDEYIDADVAVTFKVEVGVMPFRLRDLGHVVEELDPGDEILGDPLAMNPRPVVGESPALNAWQEGASLLKAQGRDAPLARDAMLAGQVVVRRRVVIAHDP